MNDNGWADIAYSYVIDPADLTIYEARGFGVQGGHTLGHNSISHGICVMGNFETTLVQQNLLVRIAELVRHGHGRGWWPVGFTGGHRDVRATKCPGANLYRRIDEINRLAIRDDVEDGMSLRPGDNGEAVRKIQTGLKGWDARALPNFGTDGDYGTETETWVQRFQDSQDLTATGVVDGLTAALLLEFHADIVETT